MGNEAEFHFGKKRSREGLEFVGGRKRSAFRQKVDSIEREQSKRTTHHHSARIAREQTAPVTPEAAFEPAVPIQAPEAVLPVQASVADPLYHIYQEPILSGDAPEDDLLDYKPTPHKEPVMSLHDKEEAKSALGRKLLSYLMALVALAIIVLSALFIMHNTPNIPSSIRKKAGYTLYELAPNPTFKFDKKSVQLASEGNVVFFADNPKNKAHYVVSQQRLPEVVKNETDYQQFLADFDKYAETDSPLGKAYFTHPSGIGSDISVVVKTKTTLIFIRGPGTTSESDWTSFLGYLRVVN